MMLAWSGLIGLGILGSAASERRQALWGVVELCVADARTTGSPFPCLAVDISKGEERGWVVLRPPVGRPDTILSPTRKTVGIEDVWLQSADAPNYFASAWSERRLAPGAERWLDDPGAMGLAVNSRSVREQDQLHVHIGCLKRPVRSRLRSLASKLEVGAWTPAGSILPGHPAWALRTGESDISRLRPFRLAKPKVGVTPWADLAEITLGVIPVQVEDSTEFVVVAFLASGLDRYVDVGGDDFLDARCSS